MQVVGQVMRVKELPPREGDNASGSIHSVSVEGFSLLYRGKDVPDQGAMIRADVSVYWPKSNGSGKKRRPQHWLQGWRPFGG